MLALCALGTRQGHTFGWGQEKTLQHNYREAFCKSLTALMRNSRADKGRLPASGTRSPPLGADASTICEGGTGVERGRCGERERWREGEVERGRGGALDGELLLLES